MGPLDSPKSIRMTAILNLAVAIAIGAFGAHLLKKKLSPEAMVTFHTGHDYHMWIAILTVAIALSPLVAARSSRSIVTLLLAGTLLFSGSLYLYALTGTTAWAMITPLGGLCWIASLVWFAIKGLPREPDGDPSKK